MVLLASVGLAAALLAMIAHAQPHQYPVCSVIDGSAESSNSPCACGTSTCSWYETMCTSASNLCQATCGRYSCPPDSVQQGRFTQKRNGVDLETNPDDSKCCQESCLLLTSATCQSRLDCAWMGSSCSTAVCNHDDSARRRADVSCAHFKSDDKCALASSSRRRTYGGEARDTCQTTCATSIGCQVPTPAPTPLPLGATYSPTMAICAADSTSLCSYRANVPSNRRRQCMHSASFTADCQTSCSAEAGCKVATQGVDCLRIVAANAIGQTFCLDAIEFWNRESCDGIKVSVSGTPFASGSWSGSAPSMAFDSDFSSGPWCSNDGPHASSAPYIGMAWSSPVFIGCVRIKGGQGHTAIKLQTCTGGGGTAGSFSVSADVTGVSGWHAITIPFEDPKAPTESPTSFPSESPTTEAPTTSSPTEPPTDAPTTSSPTEAPTTSSPTEASSTLCGDWPSNSTYGCKHGDVYQRLSDYTSHAACQNLCGQQVATVGNLCCYVKIGSGC
jgi:cell division septation protein DedD